MNKEHGFVMADALAALLIATLFATGLLGANGLTVTAASKAHDRLTATYVARAILIESQGTTSGTVLIDGAAFSWTKERHSRAFEAGDVARLEDVDVTVSWRGAHEMQNITLHTTKIRGRDG